MNWHEEEAKDSPEVKQALKYFKSSMDAWSDAALSRPRMMVETEARSSWRPAAGWALGCLLVAGSVTIAVHHFVQRKTAVPTAQTVRQKPAAQQTAAKQVNVQMQSPAPVHAVAKQEAGVTDEDLLASVDQDISRQVPAEMEPLAQLMDDNGAQ